MLEFREIKIEDKKKVRELLAYSDFRGCEYTFGNNFIWSRPYNMKIAFYKEFYLVESDGEYFYPAGRGDIGEAIFLLKEYCKAQGKNLILCTSPKSGMEYLKELYGDGIEIQNKHDYFDYCYNRDDLAYLIGKKYHSKRNFINRFIQNNWSYEDITESNIKDCYTLLEKWFEENTETRDQSMEDEVFASKLGLEYFKELDLTGGLLRVDGAPTAFTFGERINSDTFDIHVEKGLALYDGTYPMINKEYANRLPSDIKYINREEDMGEENLRKAKQSYHPVFMEEKFRIIFKD